MSPAVRRPGRAGLHVTVAALALLQTLVAVVPLPSPESGTAAAPGHPRLARESPGGATTIPSPSSAPVGTNNSVTARIEFGTVIGTPVYDPTSGHLFVPETGGSLLAVVDPRLNELVATVPVGENPGTPCLDNATDELYVPNANSHNVTVVSALTDRTVANISVDWDLSTPTFDWRNGDVYVPTEASGGGEPNLTVVNGVGHAVVTTIHLPTALGSVAQPPAFDPSNGELFVAVDSYDYAENWLDVINGTTNSVVTVLSVGDIPSAATYDPTDGRIVVPNTYDASATIVDASNNSDIKNVSVGGSPGVATVDPSTGNVFVPVGGGPDVAGNLTVLSSATDSILASIPTGSDPTTPAFDAATGDVYAANVFSPNVTVASGSTLTAVRTIGVGLAELAPTVVASSSEIFVPDRSTELAVIYAGPFEVVQLTVAPSPTVVRTPAALHLDFRGGSGPVTVGYTNLPPGCSSADVDPLVCSPTKVGTYDVTAMANDSQGDHGGAALSWTVRPPFSYLVEFAENGLPTGANWSVTLNGSTEGALSGVSDYSAIDFNETNGTYAYTVAVPSGYDATPSTGSVVVNGSERILSIAIASVVAYAPLYVVRFVASGLPAGSMWNVTFNGSTVSTTNGTVWSPPAPTGTYPFSIGPPPGYEAMPATGDVTIPGTDVLKAIGFTLTSVIHAYQIVLAESGLPTGTDWSVTLNGTVRSGAAATIAFPGLANGTYRFSVAAVAGYSANPSAGSVVVYGENTSTDVTFTSLGGSGGSSASVSPSERSVLLIVAVLAAIAVGVGVFVWRRRPPPPAEDSVPTTPEPAFDPVVEVYDPRANAPGPDAVDPESLDPTD